MCACVCMFYVPVYLKTSIIASNTLKNRETKIERVSGNCLVSVLLYKEILLTFYPPAIGQDSHGPFLTLFQSHDAQECILEVQWIKMPCQLGMKKENLHPELSVIFSSFLYYGKLVKSSPSSHKLAGRFISSLTFSLEMPPGTWASALWREMTRLLLGVVESYSLVSSPLPLLHFFSFSSSFLIKPVKKQQQPLTR